MSQIIFLNGCSSSGKTSISKAIQTLSKTPWLHVGIDTFISMLPQQFYGDGDRSKEGYFSFNTFKNNRGAYVQVKTEPRGVNFFYGHVPKVVRLLADLGHDIIVDEVICDKVILDQYLHTLKPHRVFVVHVICEFNVLQERERKRGDRAVGLVNDQWDRLQSYTYTYDLTLDTTHTLPRENAQLILDAIK